MSLRVENAATTMIAALTLIAASSPGWMFGLALFCAIAWLVVGMAWLLRASAFSIDRRATSRARALLRLCIFPIVLFVTVIAVVQHVPLCLRIKLHEAELLRAIESFRGAPEQFLVGGPRHEEIWRIGTFRVTLDDCGNGVSVPYGDTVSFATGMNGFIDAGGFVYDPKRIFIRDGEGEGVERTHLFGPWVRWEERW